MPKRLDTKLDGLVLIEPEVHGDERGFLVETYRDELWRQLGADIQTAQENHSRSGANILRGLHFQTSPGQAKLVRCMRGRIWDVAVDPYKLSSLYDPATEAGIAWDDPDVAVEWPISEPMLSERDKTAPRLSEIADSLPW
jgi:dTDP-4-dehydrorhamnose 3,5-epimerase